MIGCTRGCGSLYRFDWLASEADTAIDPTREVVDPHHHLLAGTICHRQGQILLNHLGGPIGIGTYADRRDEVFEERKLGLDAAAACPNVFLKLGGIGMEWYFGMGWNERETPPSSELVAEYWGYWLRYAIEAFGPHRCMFESNFPVDRVSLPYSVLWNAFQIIAAEYNDTEQQDLFAGTARRAYKL